jgi:hypothetical protein
LTLLKVKAKIYQYTGLYLAKKEEYTATSLHRRYPLSDENNRFDLSLAIGSWQAANGLCRLSNPVWTKISIHRLRKNKARHAYYSVLGWFVGFYLQLRYDFAKKKE